MIHQTNGARVLRVACGLLLFLPVTAFAGLLISPTYVDGLGETWTATRRGVVQQALNDWGGLFQDTQTVFVTLDFTSAGLGGYLGQWEGGWSVPGGTDIFPWTSGVTHTIHFNKDYFTSTPNYLWFDPSPSTGGDVPFEAWDALSIARHEVGHMLGFTSDFYRADSSVPASDKWKAQITGQIFDPSGLNVTLASTTNLSHVLDGGKTLGDLMVPALVNGTRRGISTWDENMLVQAYGYTVPEPGTLGLLVFGSVTVLWGRRKGTAK